MADIAVPTTFRQVDTDTGKNVKQRRIDLGMSVKGLAERARIDRGTLAALEAGDPSVRATTIASVEAALSRLEHEMGMDVPERAPGEPDRVVIRVTGNFGVEVVVEGPVRDLAALQEFVDHQVEKMQRGQRRSDSKAD